MLQLQGIFTTSKECQAVVNVMSTSEERALNWNSQHMKYLVMPTAVPGSGVTTTISCDLSAFKWEFLIRKCDFDLDIMQAILSLGAVIATADLRTIVNTVRDSKTEVLTHALDKFTPPLASICLNSLCTHALKLGKENFHSIFLSRGATVEAASILKEIPLPEITRCKWMYSSITSTPKGCILLVQSALDKGNFKALESCEIPQSYKNEVDLGSFVQPSVQGSTEKKKKCIQFIGSLLESGRVNSNGLQGEKHPLDVVLELSNVHIKEKMELLCLLLQHGADIQHCTFPRKKQTTFLHIATQFTIDDGKLYKH